MGSTVLSNRNKTGKTPRNPSAHFRRPRGSYKTTAKTAALPIPSSSGTPMSTKETRPTSVPPSQLPLADMPPRWIQTCFLIVLKREIPLATLPRASEGHWVPKRRVQERPNCHLQGAKGGPCRRRKRGPRQRLARGCLWPTCRRDGFKRSF